MAADADRNCAVEELTKYVIWYSGSAKPTPRGSCFADTYMDANFSGGPISRDTDCYVSVNNRYNAREIDSGGRGLTLKGYRAQLGIPPMAFTATTNLSSA